MSLTFHTPTLMNQEPIPAVSSEPSPVLQLSTLFSAHTDLRPLNVLVFGPTGTGKSTIINHLTYDSANLPIGHDLESCTADITPASVVHKGRLITFLDTPGFDDSDKTPAEHFILLMARFRAMYDEVGRKPHIHGVFYVHRITDNKMTKSTKLNLHIFREILGDDVLKNLVFVTNRWETPVKDQHIRFEQLPMDKDEYFGGAIKKGARAGAAYRICEQATRAQVQEALLDVFLETSPEVLQIQREMVEDDAKEILKTKAGMILREELRKSEHNLQTKLKGLERQLEHVPETGKEEAADILADIAAGLEKVRVQNTLLRAKMRFLSEFEHQSGLATVTASIGASAASGSAFLFLSLVVSSGGEAMVALGTAAACAWWKASGEKALFHFLRTQMAALEK